VDFDPKFIRAFIPDECAGLFPKMQLWQTLWLALKQGPAGWGWKLL
jgi:hypothetical protein